jgi:hypothetical protein
MNRLLIGVLDILNKIVALLIIVSGAVSGYQAQFGAAQAGQPSWPSGLVGALLGLVGGVVVAGLVSGFLAAIITMSRELTTIRELAIERLPVVRPPV